MKTKKEMHQEIIFKIFLLIIVSIVFGYAMFTGNKGDIDLGGYLLSTIFVMFFALLIFSVSEQPKKPEPEQASTQETANREIQNIQRAWRISARFSLIYTFFYGVLIVILKTLDKQIYFRWFLEKTSPSDSLHTYSYETHVHWFLGLNPIINLPVIMIFGISIWLLFDFFRSLELKKNYSIVKLCLVSSFLILLIIGFIYGAITGRFVEALVNFGIMGFLTVLGLATLVLILKFIVFLFTKDPWLYLFEKFKQFVSWFVS